MKTLKISCFVLLLALHAQAQDKKNLVIPNENLITENIAPISKELAQKVKKYAEGRGASLATIHPVKDQIIISTRFGSTNQLHLVTQPMGARKQITFLTNPLMAAPMSPQKESI